MKRFFLLAAVILAAVSCGKTPTARISGTVESLEDSCLVLQRLNFNTLEGVDTVKLAADGSFDFKVKLPTKTPEFYYLYDGASQIAAAVLLPGDNVKIKVGKYGDYEVEGSEESALLREINQKFMKANLELSQLADEAVNAADEAALKDANVKMSRAYVQYKRDALAYIMGHTRSITSAAVVFQKFHEDLPVFNELTDVIMFKQLCDSLQTVYRDSRYVTALRDEISRRENDFQLNQKIEQIQSISFPELNLPDISGKDCILSSLTGKVIILSFWSVSQNDHKMFNQEILDMYNRLHASGLEIYQVSLDIDKPTWAAAVNNQKLPWISVNDGLGTASPAVASYNVTKLPTMYVINRQGDIVGKDVYSVASLEALVKRYL